MSVAQPASGPDLPDRVELVRAALPDADRDQFERELDQALDTARSTRTYGRSATSSRPGITDAIFAASLEEVVADTAPGTYGDAETFFASTFPSGGLKTLLNEALGRVGGAKPDGASVNRFSAAR